MAVATENFTTGPSVLPDVGILRYNNCLFSPLFESNISGVMVKDNALRTVKYIEYTISVDGYVTLPAGEQNISSTMDDLRLLLTAQGGTLFYTGRGFDLNINVNAGGFGGSVNDVAWGPSPELLEFQPLGAGRSAKVRWQVKVRIPEQKHGRLTSIKIPVLQFNYETIVSYGEDGFSRLNVKGSMEIALTRTPRQNTRTIPRTADDIRDLIENRILSQIDLSRFHITSREFNLSRDKRTLEWSVTAEEKPYMDIPPDCTIARGSFSFRPARQGMGLCTWLCTLRATYTVRSDKPRRSAWFAFLALLRWRMGYSRLGNIPAVQGGVQNPAGPPLPLPVRNANTPAQAGDFKWGGFLEVANPLVKEARKAFLIDLSGDEGLYLDSKTVTFSATWRLVTTFSHILLASGLWRKLLEKDAAGNNYWAINMASVSGSESWLANKVDANLDLIIDFGA